MFLGAIIRVLLHKFFYSHYFRALVKNSKRHAHDRRRHNSPLLTVARIWRKVRMTLVRNQLPETLVAQYFGLPRFVAGIVVCLLYVIDTYMQGVPTHFYVFQMVYGLTIMGNLFLNYLYAERPVLYCVSLTTVIECLSIPSLLFASGGRWLNFNFLQAFCILVEWSVLERHDIVLRNNSTLPRLLINLLLQMITFVFITSCGVQFFELLGDPGQTLRSETFQITWANSVYFAVVTLMTVGYGDFVPYTLLGRLWIVFHIIFAAFLVSREISLLIDALKSMRRGGGSYVKASGIEHIVVTGHVKWEFLQQFVKEFLAERINLDTRVIVLTSSPNWTDDDWNKFVSHNPFYDHHLIFLEGSPLRMDDLTRAHVAVARGVFVLADPHRNDPYREDSDTLKVLLTVRSFSGTVPIYTLNTLYDSSFQFRIAMKHFVRDYNAQQLQTMQAGGLGASRTYQTFLQTPSTPFPEHLMENSMEGLMSGRPSGLGLAGSPVLSHYNETGGSVDATTNLLGSASNNLYSREDTAAPAAPSFGLFGLPAATAVMGLGVSTVARPARRPKVARSSASVCMQELEMTLLAENVFCNGLSTFITNLMLRVVPQSRSSDRPWLVEYKLGAECSMQRISMPASFHGHRFKDIAVVLQDYGLVVIAVKPRECRKWRLVTVSTVLEAGMPTMVLSYHDHSVIDKIAEHAGDYVRQSAAVAAATASAAAATSAASTASVAPAAPSASAASASAASGITARRGHAPHGSVSSRVGIAGASHSLEETNILTMGDRSTVDPSTMWLSDSDGETFVTQMVPVSGAEDSTLGTRGSQKVGQGDRHHSLKRAKTSESVSMKHSRSMTPARAQERASSSEEDSPVHDTTADKSKSRLERGTSKIYDGSEKPAQRKDTKKRSRGIYSNLDSLPAHLLGHVIVCLDGEHPLISLDMLLQRIWRKRTTHTGKRVPVVVIHPNFPKNYEREIASNGQDLFLLKGNSLSLDTLKQAQFHTSRAILIMAPENNDLHASGSTDSKAIFTVMTLDSLLADNASTFVCCVLDAEDSLQLLRAPRHARRVGVNLGEQREAYVFYRDPPSFSSMPRRTTSSTSFIGRSLPSSPYISAYSNLGFGGAYGSVPGVLGAAPRNMLKRAPSISTGLRAAAVKRSSSMRFDRSDSSQDEEPMHGRDVRSLRDQHHNQQGSREELHERQRYASGEMIITSLFTAVLAREYSDPGYVNVVRQLIGADCDARGSWVRLVDIPESWMHPEQAIEGRTYRETVLRLQRLGGIALGLYRSGEAPVRVELESEHWERRTDEVVYHTADEITAKRADENSPSLATRLTHAGSSVRRLHEVEHRRQASQGHFNMRPGSSASPPPLSVEEKLRALAEGGDEFDKMYYTCPTTKRRIYYQEAVNGENVLPYVYCCPEPYSLVCGSDAVFVLCDPDLVIPPDWGL